MIYYDLQKIFEEKKQRRAIKRFLYFIFIYFYFKSVIIIINFKKVENVASFFKKNQIIIGYTLLMIIGA